MAAALTELLLLVSALTSFHFVDSARVAVPYQGAPLLTTGYTTCEFRRPTVTLATRAETLEATLLHELAHARDCLDDGEIDGSLLAPGTQLLTLSPHCLSNRAELYACWVTERAAVADATAARLEPQPVGGPAPEHEE